MNLNNINIKANQKELLSKAEDIADTVRKHNLLLGLRDVRYI